jgi:ribonucleoside-diphosphate reductase alpha chain
VLVSNSKEEKKNNWSPLRPKVLEADVIRFQNNEEKWIAFVGIKDGVHMRYSQACRMMRCSPFPRA